jgi:hypothetical protein
MHTHHLIKNSSTSTNSKKMNVLTTPPFSLPNPKFKPKNATQTQIIQTTWKRHPPAPKGSSSSPSKTLQTKSLKCNDGISKTGRKKEDQQSRNKENETNTAAKNRAKKIRCRRYESQEK